jgi:hypothetical protein
LISILSFKFLLDKSVNISLTFEGYFWDRMYLIFHSGEKVGLDTQVRTLQPWSVLLIAIKFWWKSKLCNRMRSDLALDDVHIPQVEKRVSLSHFIYLFFSFSFLHTHLTHTSRDTTCCKCTYGLECYAHENSTEKPKLVKLFIWHLWNLLKKVIIVCHFITLFSYNTYI